MKGFPCVASRFYALCTWDCLRQHVARFNDPLDKLKTKLLWGRCHLTHQVGFPFAFCWDQQEFCGLNIEKEAKKNRPWMLECCPWVMGTKPWCQQQTKSDDILQKRLVKFLGRKSQVFSKVKFPPFAPNPRCLPESLDETKKTNVFKSLQLKQQW